MCSKILVSTRWSLFFQTKKCRLVSLGQVLTIQNGRPGIEAGGVLVRDFLRFGRGTMWPGWCDAWAKSEPEGSTYQNR